MKVVVSVFNNLYTDQRVEKVCNTLYKNGFDIFLIGNTWQGSPPLARPYSFFRIPIRAKILRFGYLEFQWKLYKKLLKETDSKTILLANDLDTLLPNYLVSKKKKLPLVFDSHEIFTEMPAVSGRWVQHIWRRLEKMLVPRMKYMFTASDHYAIWFQEKYKIEKPVVIRNFPKKSEREKEILGDYVIYQGTLNPSRGLDKLLYAMPLVEAQLVIAGDGPERGSLETLSHQLGLQKKVIFIGKVSPSDLTKLTSRAAAGFSIEENNGLSYYYSLPNKIADYIQARVPIVISNFPEFKAVIEQFNVGEIIENHTPEHLAEKTNIVLHNGKKYYAKNLEKAAAEYCWENEEPKLLEVFHRAASHLK